MNAINYSEYESEHPVDVLTEARLAKKGFEIRLERANWTSIGRALIETSNSCLIRLRLPPGQLERKRSARNAGTFSGLVDQRFKPLGPMLFIPHGTQFHLQHGICQQKALVCLFNPSALNALAAYEWDWDGLASERMLNLQNLYLKTSLQRLTEEVITPGFASELHTECLLTSIALDLRKEFLGTKDMNGIAGKLSPRQLRLLYELLEAGPEEELSLRHLADACALPVRKLSLYFKNTTGTTLRQYAAETRVKKAMALLADQQLLVKQVAFQTGFQNAASFTAAFRKSVGVTPEEYRRRRSC